MPLSLREHLGETDSDLMCRPEGSQPHSRVGQQGHSKQQQQERAWQVPLTHAMMGAFEIQGVTNPFAPLLIWAFIPPNEAFCQLPPGDTGLRPVVPAFVKLGLSYTSP